MSDDTISLSEALAVIEQLSVWGRSFEKVKELIATANKAQNDISSLQSRKDQILSEIESIKSDHGKAMDDFDSFVSEVEIQKQSTQEKINKELSDLRAETDKQKEFIRVELISNNSQLELVKNEISTTKKRLDSEIQKRQETLDGLNDLIEQTKARLKGLV